MMWPKDLDFSSLSVGDKEGENERNPGLLSVILKVPSVEICRAKN